MLLNLNTNNDFSFILGEAGTNVLINGTPARALITNTPLSESKDTKKITTLENIERGFVIDYDSSKWLIISGDKRYSRHKGIIQKCNNTFTLNIGGILYKVPCIVTDRVALNINSTSYIATLDNEIYILVANNEINSNIKLNDIYKIGQKNYKVVSIDDITQAGLLSIKLEHSEAPQVLPIYSITITNGDTLTTNIETPVQLLVEQKDGDTVLTNPLPMVFTSSDETIATVDNNGLVTPVAVGQVMISVALESDPSVSDSIEIIIEEVPMEDNYTITIDGATTVKLNNNITLTATVRNNGVVDESKVVSWNIRNQDGSSNQYLSVVSIQGNTITLKATSNSSYINRYVIIEASFDGVTVEHTVQLKSLF